MITKPQPPPIITASELFELWQGELQKLAIQFDSSPGPDTHEKMMDCFSELQAQLAELADPRWRVIRRSLLPPEPPEPVSK